MLCLRAVSGLPLDLDIELERIIVDDVEADYQTCRHVSLQEISPTLLNKSLRYPEEVYSQHCHVVRKSNDVSVDSTHWPENYTYDVYFLPSGLLGIEYSKTHVYRSQSSSRVASVIQLLSGQLTVLLQHNAKKEDPYDFSESVETAQMVEMQEGDKLAVPAQYYYTFVNTGHQPAVFARVVREEHVVESQDLRKTNGLAYYLISKNARLEIVSNPKYRNVSTLKQVSPAELNNQLEFITRELPLYEEVVQNSAQYENALG